MAGLKHQFKVTDFDVFFEAVHGKTPFKWQSMLMEQVKERGWPDLIDLPTASGKTACIDVAVFALAMGVPSPRRIWFVVDRRIVVDEAYIRAEKIADALVSPTDKILRKVRANLLEIGGHRENEAKARALGVARLRGGAPRTVAWTRNPMQPAIITSTIDQLGSRLLFRGYGVSDRAKPMHAALTGNDSLIILDEAHLAQPFFETVTAVQKFRGTPWAKEPLEKQPFHLMVMSATPPEEKKGENRAARSLVTFPSDKQRKEALCDDELKKRMNASKPAELMTTNGDNFAVDAAKRAVQFINEKKQRIAVMVNRVAAASEIVKEINNLLPPQKNKDNSETLQAEVLLLTGRMRPVDRDQFIQNYQGKLASGSEDILTTPIILVTTQCLEVGADFSFDALVTECASLDSLRQRFGRLNRLGRKAYDPAKAVVLMRKKDIKSNDALNEDKPADPIYGNAIVRTWNWLSSINSKTVDMGIAALEPHIHELMKLGPALLAALSAPRLSAPIMLPAYLDLWSQTNPRPSLEADIALFLHGVPPREKTPRVDVQVLWRKMPTYPEKDVESCRDLLEATPPLSMEMLTLPLRDFIQAVEDPHNFRGGDDMEGGFDDEKEKNRETTAALSNPQFIIWRDGKLLRDGIFLNNIERNDVVVLSDTDSRIFEAICPIETHLPLDVYEWAYFMTTRCVAVRYPLAFRTILGNSDIERWRDDLPKNEDIRHAAISGFQLCDKEYPQGLKMMEQLKDHKYKLHVTPFNAQEPDFSNYLLIQKPLGEPLEDWGYETDAEEDELSEHGTPRRYLLQQHTEDVKDAIAYLTPLVNASFASALQQAAELHDVGKADPRFQNYLANQHVSPKDELLAKSRGFRSKLRDRRAADFYHLPQHFRHESASVQWADSTDADLGQYADLILHMIESHHGFGRPSSPMWDDAAPPDLIYNGKVLSGSARKEHQPWHLDSGVSQRFWKLTRHYGWWGLAYLESLLRWADQYASAKRQEDDQ